MKELLSGNAAIARGAWEAGVVFASAYPGTPSTETLENIVKYKDDLYCEWAPNEKVALEAAVGACLTGARALCCMKHVGLNVAADPLMTLTSIGTEGGLIIIVADDPGMHSSQNEQDTRNYARFAKIPILEPSDSQQAKDFVRVGLDISEKYRTPVILRSTTRISHSRSLVELRDRTESDRKIGFEKNPPRYVPIPLWGRVMRQNVEERLAKLVAEAESSPINNIEMNDTSLGIITSSITYQYVKETWPEASVLKLGMAYPFPDKLIREFAGKVDKLLIVEELDDILEQHIKAMGIECVGREFIPGIGEHTPTRLAACRAKMDGRELPPQETPEFAKDLPPRPPVLCPGCPHRGVFYSLGKHDVVVTGDIGCYSLGTFKPLNRLDTILCMGGGVSMAHGMDKATEPKKVVGMVGDSTFFHSGITGLLDIAYNKGRSTIIVVDNRTTAMTGHQDHPGTGRTLMGEETVEASIAEIGKACGIKRVYEVFPYDIEKTNEIISQEINSDEPSLIVSKAPCILKDKNDLDAKRTIDQEKCRNCKACLKLGCPAIEYSGDKPQVSAYLCVGCGLCQQVCPFGAILTVEE